MENSQSVHVWNSYRLVTLTNNSLTCRVGSSDFAAHMISNDDAIHRACALAVTTQLCDT